LSRLRIGRGEIESVLRLVPRGRNITRIPGVLIIEAMAQAGGILLLNTVPDPENKLVYFMGIDGVRFRKPVKPGDQLRFEVEMVQFRRGTCKMKGQAFVGPDLVTEAELMATIVDK